MFKMNEVIKTIVIRTGIEEIKESQGHESRDSQGHRAGRLIGRIQTDPSVNTATNVTIMSIASVGTMKIENKEKIEASNLTTETKSQTGIDLKVSKDVAPRKISRTLLETIQSFQREGRNLDFNVIFVLIKVFQF